MIPPFPSDLPSMPAPSSPAHEVTEDGVIIHGEMDDEYQEVIPGCNPDTGEPDGQYDGRVSVSVPLRRTDEIHATPNPHAPKLAEAVRSSDLVIARDLGTGLAEIWDDEHTRQQAREARRALNPRSDR